MIRAAQNAISRLIARGYNAYIEVKIKLDILQNSPLLRPSIWYNGGKKERNTHMLNTTFVFDFDHTLAVTACKSFKDYSDPSFIEDAIELPLTTFAASISDRAEVKILTARGSFAIKSAIYAYCMRNGIAVSDIVTVADEFKSVKIKGKNGRKRGLRTEEKKALILARWSADSKVCFWDDCPKNIAEAAKIDGVITTKVER